MMKAIAEKTRQTIISWEHIFFADSPRAYRVSFLFLATVVVLTAYLLFSKPCVHQWESAGDASFILDYAWRLLNGQRAHSDFHDPTGVLYFLVVALGMKIAGATGKALVYGPTTIFPLLTVWTWVLARRRSSALDALMLSLLVGFLVIGVYPIGLNTFRDTSFASHYNRLGWALFSMLILQLFITPRTKLSLNQTLLEAISGGVLLSLLLFLKINYFLVGLFVVIAYAVLSRPRVTVWMAFTAGCFAACTGILLIFNLDLMGYFHDIRMQASTRDLVRSTRFLLLTAPLDNLAWMGVLFLLTALLSTPFFGEASRSRRLGWYRTVLVAWALVFLGFVVSTMNTQQTHIPVFALAAFLLCEEFRRRQSSLFTDNDLKNDRPLGIRYLSGKLLMLYLLGMITLPDMGSVWYAHRWQHLCAAQHLPASARIDTATMTDLLYPPQSWEPVDVELAIDLTPYLHPTPYRFAVSVNEGLRLLAPHVGTQARVLTFGSVNPFPFALALPSPRGTRLWWNVSPYGQSVDERTAPPPDEVLGDATHVMIRKGGSGTIDFMLRLYGAALNERFKLIDESNLWTLYQRVDYER